MEQAQREMADTVAQCSWSPLKSAPHPKQPIQMPSEEEEELETLLAAHVEQAMNSECLEELEALGGAELDLQDRSEAQRAVLLGEALIP